MKLMARVIHHLIFQRRHGLNAENLTSAQHFPPFGEVVLLLFNSVYQHFRRDEVVMENGSDIIHLNMKVR